jgi:HKD family nuclease
MKLIKSPWHGLFCKLVKSSRKSIKITSPFIKEKIVLNLFDSKKPAVKVSLITSFKLMNFYTGASDLNALEVILKKNGVVSNYQKLHSKIYIFDDTTAIISSGNLTVGGLIHNYEYGVLIEDKNSLNEISNDFGDLLKDEATGKISYSEIEKAKDIISKIPKSTPIVLDESEINKKSGEFEIYTGGIETIISSLKGWKLEIFKCLMLLPKPTFSLNDLTQFKTHLQRRFPSNNFIEAKIRQQLQYLRDIGLVEFLGNGKYKKLWK